MPTLAVLFALGAAGCSPGNAPMDSGQGGIELSVDRVVVEDGGSTSLGAYAQARPGARRVPLNPATDLTWESSHPEVASVEAGVVRGLRPGEARITARNTSGWTAHAQVIVESVPFALEFVGLPELRGEVAGLLPDSLTVRVIDRHGTPLPQVTVQFGTEDAGGAAAPASRLTDANGVARVSWSLGVQAGPQRLQARLAQRPDRWTQVEAVALPGPVASVQLIPPSNPRVNGAPIPIAARLDDAFGNGVPGVPVSWTIISGGGSVRSLTDGTNQEGHLDAEWVLGDLRFEQTVSARPGNGNGGGQANHTLDLRGVTVSPSSGTVEMREGIQLTAVFTDNRGQAVDDPNLRWTSSDQAVASVSSEGLVHGVTPGTATITATANGRSDSAVITVLPGEEEVNSPPENDDGSEGEDSSNEEDGSGDGTGDGSGSEEGDDAGTVDSVAVSPGKSSLKKDQKVELKAIALDDSGHPVEASSFRWTSSNPAVVQVEGTGASAVITALSSGSAAITAEVDGVTGVADVDVSEPTSPPPSRGGLIPAFPGAEGWGAMALNECRSLPLRVHRVSNTNDSGPGSLRDILENQTSNSIYDIVVFLTGGTIASQAMINLRRDCVYVAGQTAPGDGIMIRSHPTNGHNGHLLRVLQRSDIAIRFLRFRHGQEGGYRGGGLISTGFGNGRDIIFDHISSSWGGGSSHIQIATSDPDNPDHALQGTIQNSLLGEGFENVGASFRGATRSGNPGDGESYFGLRRMSYHKNLSALIGQRHPAVSSGDARITTSEGTEVVNNVMYAAKNQFTEASDQTVLDFVGNYQDPGPNYRNRRNRWDRATGSLPLNPQNPGSLYAAGNHMVGFSGSDFDSWVDRYDNSSPLPASFRRSHRLAPPPVPIQEMSASAARDRVLNLAGASMRLTCRGDLVGNRDSVDRRIVEYVRDRGGPFDAFGMTVHEINGAWPTMRPGQSCSDQDGDGLPDEWEERYFGCPTCADPNAPTPSGYLTIEHYLNGTNPHG
jgi:pectate lyase